VPPDLVNTGVQGLDEILCGGLPRRRTYLLRGTPGVGKTTLGLQFLLEGVRQGESGLYVTLSETREELAAVADSHGWSIDGFRVHPLSTPEEMLEAQRQNTLFHPAEVELNETIERVLAVVDESRPQRIVIDSLSEMRLLAGDSLRYRRQILALKQQFATRDATVLFLDDGSAERGDTQLESLAHGVIELERTAPEYGSARRRLEVLKLRGVDFLTGKHDFTIQRGGLRVFPRLVAASHRSTQFRQEVLSSGRPGLDAMLGGGLQRGTSTVILGPAGTGKSTLASQYAEAALDRKQRVAWFSFDETLEVFTQRVRGQGIRLEDNPLFSLRQVDPAELTPGEFAQACRDQVDNDTRLLVIDSLNGYLMAMPEDRYLILHLHELLSYLGQQGVTTLLLLAQAGMVGRMESPVDVTYLADAVFILRFFEDRGRVRKALSVLKRRVGPHEDTIREVKVTDHGLEVGEPLNNFHGVLTGIPSILPERGKTGALE
jgi:circadian clock protein KaiC